MLQAGAERTVAQPMGSMEIGIDPVDTRPTVAILTGVLLLFKLVKATLCQALLPLFGLSPVLC